MIIFILYLIGSILAGILQILHLRLWTKKFGKGSIPSFKKYWISYTIFILTSWVGFIILVGAIISAWIKKVY